MKKKETLFGKPRLGKVMSDALCDRIAHVWQSLSDIDKAIIGDVSFSEVRTIKDFSIEVSPHRIRLSHGFADLDGKMTQYAIAFALGHLRHYRECWADEFAKTDVAAERERNNNFAEIMGFPSPARNVTMCFEQAEFTFRPERGTQVFRPVSRCRYRLVELTAKTPEAG